ncbi:NAD kinase [Bienertia sinuspersici]
MDKRVLRLNYMGKIVDVVIDDIDECVLIDVINEMCDEFEKRGWELPAYPSLHYCFREKAIKLIDDKTMMQMFEDIRQKRIDVWIGELTEPSFIWGLAMKVRESKVKESNEGVKTVLNQVSQPVSNRQKLPVRRNKNIPQKNPDVISLAPEHQLNLRRSPRMSPNNPPSPPNRPSLPRMVDEMSMSPPHISLSPPETDLNVQSTQPNIRSSPRFSPPNLNSQTPEVVSNHNEFPSYSKSQSSSQHIITQSPTTSTNPKPSNVSLRPPAFSHGKKLAKTTAVAKGIWISQNRSTTHGVDEGDCASRPKVRARHKSNAVVTSFADSGSSSDTEDDYEPPLESDEESDGYDIDDFEEEENPSQLLMENYVDGGWEPFRKADDIYEDDGGYLSRMYKNGEVYDDAGIGKIRLRQWQLFVDKDHFKDVLRDFCVQEGFSLVVRKADNERYTAECADVRCSWRIHASKLADEHTWAIKSLRHAHNCDLNLVNNPMANCDWAASKLLDEIRENPDIKGKALNAALWRMHGITMATSTLYKMKAKALQIIQGGHDQSYSNLVAYCELLKQKNPGSIAFCTWKQLQAPERALQFKSIFISFAAQFKGLITGCRGLVGVDGCHLKGNYGGILLSAVSLDGNNEIFPVAVAVVDSENKTSWSWFFHHLKNILTETGREDWTIMSDRQKGIDPSLDDVWPTVSRRYCARHLCKNFKKEYPGVLMHKLFWSVTNAYSLFTFKKAMEQVEKFAGLGAIKWLKEIGPLDRWTRWKFDPQLCSDENTNNFVESFNSTIGVDRTYPILTLLEGVRRVAMVRHATRQQLCQEWRDDGICPNIIQQVRVLTKDSRTCLAYPAGRGEYEVSDGRSMLPVSLSNRMCVCGRWQVSGIPCKHGIKAILNDGKDPLHFVSDWYSVGRYKQAYNGNILPIPDSEHWPDMDVPKLIPPTMKRSIGRPSRNRRREEGEQKKGKRSTTVQCGKCKEYGHNAQTCKGGVTKKEKLAQQGL